MDIKTNEKEMELAIPTLADIKKLSGELRAFDVKWTAKLAKLMNCTPSRVRNIVVNNTVGGESRMQFIIHGMKLKKEYQDRNEKVLNEFRQVSTSDIK